MNYCDIVMDFEPESVEEIDRGIATNEKLVAILEKGEHVLPRVIAILLNYKFYDDLGCFCQVKKRQEKGLHILKDGHFTERRRTYSVVSLYTSQIELIGRVLGDITGTYMNIETNDMKPFQTTPGDWAKVELIYDEKFTNYLLDIAQGMVIDQLEYRKEWLEDCGGLCYG